MRYHPTTIEVSLKEVIPRAIHQWEAYNIFKENLAMAIEFIRTIFSYNQSDGVIWPKLLIKTFQLPGDE